MYAIVKTGGKQYRVEQGQSLVVERLRASGGDSVQLQPLLFVDGSSVVDDADGLAGVTVAARVVGHERGPKLRVVKFKPKRGYKRRTGHRQELTRIEVTEIKAGSTGSRKRAAKEDARATASAEGPAASAEGPAASEEALAAAAEAPATEAAPTPAATAEAQPAPEQAPEAAASPDETPVTPATTTPEEDNDGA